MRVPGPGPGPGLCYWQIVHEPESLPPLAQSRKEARWAVWAEPYAGQGGARRFDKKPDSVGFPGRRTNKSRWPRMGQHWWGPRQEYNSIFHSFRSETRSCWTLRANLAGAGDLAPESYRSLRASRATSSDIKCETPQFRSVPAESRNDEKRTAR
jgi:hypothetical protein